MAINLKAINLFCFGCVPIPACFLLLLLLTLCIFHIRGFCLSAHAHIRMIFNRIKLSWNVHGNCSKLWCWIENQRWEEQKKNWNEFSISLIAPSHSYRFSIKKSIPLKWFAFRKANWINYLTVVFNSCFLSVFVSFFHIFFLLCDVCVCVCVLARCRKSKGIFRL